MRRQWHDLLSTADAWKLSLKEPRASALQARCWFRRVVLSYYTGVDPAEWVFGTGAHGKPKVLRPAGFASLHFNVSHTTGLAICLVSRLGPVGVDVEDISHKLDILQVARHFLPDKERCRLESLPEQRRVARFYEHWVLREAYLKGVGKGIAEAPERFVVRIDRHGPVSIRNWHFFLYRPSQRHVAAVAVRKPKKAASLSIRWRAADELPDNLTLRTMEGQ